MKQPKILNLVLFFFVAALTMANKECEKKPDPRILKKNVKIVSIDASTFMNSSAFNFAEQAQERMSAAVFATPYFYERQFYPKAEDYLDEQKFNAIQAASLNQKIGSQKMGSQKLQNTNAIPLKQWFPKLSSVKKMEARQGFTPDSNCLIERPQHYLFGKVLSLEAHSGGSLVFGFDQSIAQLPLQASFTLDRMKMDMSLNVFDSWTQEKTQSQIASVLKKDFSLKVGLDFGLFHIGPQIYRKTGLAEVTDQLVKKAIEVTGQALNNLESQEWKSRIVINGDNFVGILGGDELGIEIGDQFEVENENHSWLGEPCGPDSILVGSIATTLKPWIVEVDRIGTGLSRAKVLNENENESIRIGARVKIHKLYQEPVAKTK